jgi:hypothetical protein
VLDRSSCNCVQTVTTFGFRGEALSAMCALAELSIVTRTPSEGAQDSRVQMLGSSDQGAQDPRAQMLQSCDLRAGGAQHREVAGGRLLGPRCDTAAGCAAAEAVNGEPAAAGWAALV